MRNYVLMEKRGSCQLNAQYSVGRLVFGLFRHFLGQTRMPNRPYIFQYSASYRTTRCMAMRSSMALCWVGQNSCPILRHLGTKVYPIINSACARMSIVCNAIFWLTMSCCVWEIFAIKSRSCAKLLLPRRLSCEKRRKKSKISQWNIMASGQHSWRAAIINTQNVTTPASKK